MTRRDDGRWVDTITLPSGKRKYFYGRTKQEVNRKMREFKEEQDLFVSVKFSVIADEFLEFEEKAVSYNTYYQYKRKLVMMVSFFGSMDIGTIKPMDVADYLKHLVDERQPSKRTIHFHKSLLSQVMRYAVERGYIAVNPAREVSLPKGLEVGERTVPADDEMRIALEHQEYTACRMFKFALYTGLRRGEMIALTWDDIDMENHTVTVSKSAFFAGSETFVKPPKSKSGNRIVAIPDALYYDLCPDNGIVFRGRSGGMITYADWCHYMREIRNAIGINCTAHQFRHAYATMLYDCGIDVKDSQRLLGHSNTSITMDVYTHIRQTREQAINESLRNIKYDL